jgi:hypothetical protein
MERNNQGGKSTLCRAHAQINLIRIDFQLRFRKIDPIPWNANTNSNALAIERGAIEFAAFV